MRIFKLKGPVVTKVYVSMTYTLLDLLSSVMKPTSYSKHNLNSVNRENENHLLQEEQMYFGAEVLLFSSKLLNEAQTSHEKAKMC